MEAQEWQDRLEKHFSTDGVVGANLKSISEQEEAYDFAFTFGLKGQDILIHSFLSFYVDTFRIAWNFVAQNGWPENKENYPMTLAYFLVIFRSFCACEKLARKGYPYDAYALLRDIKDRAIYLCGLSNNHTTLPALIGASPTLKTVEGPQKPKQAVESLRVIKRVAMAEEKRIKNKIVGAESGLANDTKEQITFWEEMFHLEVHGSRLTLMALIGDWTSSGTLTLGPKFNEYYHAMHANRASEIGWFVTRLLPFLKLKPEAFGDEWEEKYAILDDSFKYMVTALSNIGKPIGDALIDLVETKFAFKEPFIYFEPDGTAT